MNTATQSAIRSYHSVDDAILSALLSGNRAQAMLFHVRHYGGTVHDAWYAINGLDENSNDENPDHDGHVGRVERYLAGRGSAKHNFVFTSITLAVVVAGAFLVVHNWSQMTTGIRSYSWVDATAVVQESQYLANSHWSGGRKIERVRVNYRYEYVVNGTTYSQDVFAQPYVELFDGKKWRPGDTISIIVNPDNPSQAMHHRMMYHRALPVVFGFMIMLPAIGLLSLSVFCKITYRDLERCDPVRASERRQYRRHQKAQTHVFTV